MRILGVLAVCLWLPVAALAQGADDQKLADIRLELGTLSAQIQGLRLELQSGGQTTTGISDATPILQRIDLLEQELRRVTGSVEKLQFEVGQIVADGTNRIDDLKYRLTELEGGDILNIGETPPLGTGATSTAATTGDAVVRPKLRPRDAGTTAIIPEIEPQLPLDTLLLPPAEDVVETEQSLFAAALASYNQGEYSIAAEQFGTFLTKYPYGPKAAEAAYWRGESLAANGQWNLAARSYLDSFSGAPEGDNAPNALYRLGVSLGRLGQTKEACLTLAEMGNRFPTLSPDLSQSAAQEQRALGCT